MRGEGIQFLHMFSCLPVSLYPDIHARFSILVCKNQKQDKLRQSQPKNSRNLIASYLFLE